MILTRLPLLLFAALLARNQAAQAQRPCGEPTRDGPSRDLYCIVGID